MRETTENLAGRGIWFLPWPATHQWYLGAAIREPSCFFQEGTDAAHSAPHKEVLSHLAVASAAMPGEPAMLGEPVMLKPVVPAVVVPVAMIPAMVPATPAAVTKVVHAIGRIERVPLVDVITMPCRASGQGQTEKDQEQNSLHQYSTALHRSLRFLVPIAPIHARVAIGILPPVVDVHVIHCLAFSHGQYASTSHLRAVRREGAGLGV